MVAGWRIAATSLTGLCTVPRLATFLRDHVTSFQSGAATRLRGAHRRRLTLVVMTMHNQHFATDSVRK